MTKPPTPFDKAQQCQHVFHVRRVEKLQSAEFHERDVATRQFDLKRSAVVRCAKQDRLLFEPHSLFAIIQHAFNNVASLVSLVTHRYQIWPLG